MMLLLLASAVLGAHLAVSAPKAHEPGVDQVSVARASGQVTVRLVAAATIAFDQDQQVSGVRQRRTSIVLADGPHEARMWEFE